MEWYAAYLLLGAFVGFFAGLFGIGGGLVLVPVLSLLFEAQHLGGVQNLHLALGTSMAAIIYTAAVSAHTHYQYGAVNMYIVRNMTPGLLLGTLIGALFASNVPQVYLAAFFALFVYFAALQMLLGLKPNGHGQVATPDNAPPHARFTHPIPEGSPPIHLSPASGRKSEREKQSSILEALRDFHVNATRQLPGRAGLTLTGCGIGAVSSLVSIGGGTLSVPFMLWHNVPFKQAIGTSAALGFPIALGGTIGYVATGLMWHTLPAKTLGFVYFPALFFIILGSAFTTQLGAQATHRLPLATLRRGYAVLLLVLATRMLLKSFA